MNFQIIAKSILINYLTSYCKRKVQNILFVTFNTMYLHTTIIGLVTSAYYHFPIVIPLYLTIDNAIKFQHVQSVCKVQKELHV